MNERREFDEVLGRQEEDDEVDVWGNQEPVDWSREPVSDEGLSEVARRRAVVDEPGER
jgi:hypothetical protein